jgi:hypothetical protein
VKPGAPLQIHRGVAGSRPVQGLLFHAQRRADGAHSCTGGTGAYIQARAIGAIAHDLRGFGWLARRAVVAPAAGRRKAKWHERSALLSEA